MKRIIALGIVVFVAGILEAQSSYVTRLGTDSAWECPGTIAPGAAGKSLAAGMYVSGGNTDALLLLSKSDGTLQTARRIGGSGNDQIQEVKRAADGSFIAVGTTNSAGAGLFDGLILKVSTAGIPVWMRTFGSARDDHFAHVVQAKDRGFVVLGDTDNVDTGNDLVVVKFNPSGGVVWKRTLATPGFDHASGITATSDGGALISSNTDIPGGKTIAVLSRLAPTGAVVWTRSYSSSFNFHAGASILENADHSLFFLQYVAPSINVNSRAVLSRLSSTGNVLWSKLIKQGTVPLAVFTAVLAPDGGVVLAGTSGDRTTRGVLLKLDVTGRITWKKVLDLTGNSVSLDAVTIDLGGQSLTAAACVYPDTAIDIDAALVHLPLTGAFEGGCGSLKSAPLSAAGFAVISGTNTFTQPAIDIRTGVPAFAFSNVAMPSGRVCPGQ